MTRELWDVYFKYYCKNICAYREEKQYYSKYCPNCGAMSFHDWLTDKLFKEDKK